MKLLIITITHHPGFELSDSLLAKGLLDKNYDVTYAAKSNEMYKIKNKKIKNLYCGFPGFSKSTFSKIKLPKKILFKKWTELKKMIKDHDIIILGGYRNSSWIIEYARLINKMVIYHKNPAELSVDCKITPNILLLKDIFQKKQVKSHIKYNSLKQYSKKDKYIVTGSLQYESIFNKKTFNYIKFCKKYNLDYRKKLVLFLPLAPTHHTKEYRNDYKNICNKIQENFNLLVKGHPSDIFKRKNSQYYKKNQHSWDALGINKICNPKDFYEAINHSICGVAIYSTVFVEVNLNNKPMIFVNKYDHLSKMLTNKFQRFPKKTYKNYLGWQHYKMPKNLVSEFLRKIKKSGRLYNFFRKFSYLFDDSYMFYGKDIIFEDLQKELEFISNIKKFNISKKKIGVIRSPLENIIYNIELELKKLKNNQKKNIFNIKNFIKFKHNEIKDRLINLIQVYN